MNKSDWFFVGIVLSVIVSFVLLFLGVSGFGAPIFCLQWILLFGQRYYLRNEKNPASTMRCKTCGSDLEYVGYLKDDKRKIYQCKKCDRVWGETKIPTEVYGPTSSEIKKFEEKHHDAKPCPKCGYKYYVNIFGIMLAYEEGDCSVCHGDPELRGLATTARGEE